MIQRFATFLGLQEAGTAGEPLFSTASCASNSPFSSSTLAKQSMKRQYSFGSTKVLGQTLKYWACLPGLLVYRSMHRFRQSFRVRCLFSGKWLTFCHMHKRE